METVYATDVKIMGMTGLNQDEFNDTYSSLEQKKLIGRVKNEWKLMVENINKVLGTNIYNIQALLANRASNQKEDEPSEAGKLSKQMMNKLERLNKIK